jgi:hypothetical protein
MSIRQLLNFGKFLYSLFSHELFYLKYSCNKLFCVFTVCMEFYNFLKRKYQLFTI